MATLRHFFVSVVLLSVVSPPAAAQSTRVEALAEEQAKKAKELGVEGPGKAEQVIRRVLLSPLLSGGDGAYPWFGSVFSGSGMAVGAGYLKRLEKASSINAHAGISINGSMALRGVAMAPGLWRSRLQLDLMGQWLDVKDVSFFGTGPDSSAATRQLYDFAPKELAGTATVRPMRNVSVTGSYSFLNFDSARELQLFTPAEMPGIDQSLAYHVTRAAVAYDWRTSPGYSTRGGLYRAAIERHNETNDAPFDFTATEYEVVQLVPLLREQFVLAFHGLMTLTNTDPGHDVPVMAAPYIGGGSTLRGFANRRFTDRNRLLLTAEYRWRPSRYLDMAVFLDAGQVAAERQQLTADNFETAWGLGARFHGSYFSAFRVEVARGREGLRIIFGGSQAF